MERNLHWFSSAAQMGPNVLPLYIHMKIRGRFGNLCILPSLFLPTTCPRTKPALLHSTAACGKTFLLFLLRHSSRLKGAMFLFLLPRSCSPLCRAHGRAGVEGVTLWAHGSGSRNCPGQPQAHLGLKHGQDTSSVDGAAAPARAAAMPGTLGVSKGDTGTEHSTQQHRPLCRYHWCSYTGKY